MTTGQTPAERGHGRPSAGEYAFASTMSAAISGAGLATSVVYDQEAFLLQVSSDGAPDVTVYLQNLYAEYAAVPAGEPSGQAAIVQRALQALREARATQAPEEVQTGLLLRLQTQQWVAEAFAQMETPAAPGAAPANPGWARLVNVPVGDGLALCLCIDQPLSVRFVAEAGLAELGLGLPEALAVAHAHLAERSLDGLLRLPSGVFRSPWEDTYDAARVALVGVVASVPAPGGHVVAVPNRDCLLVADGGDAAALESLVAEAEAAFDHPRAIARRLFVPRYGRDRGSTAAAGRSAPVLVELRPLRLPEGHPLYGAVRRLEVLDRSDAYAAQKRLLDARLAAAGIDLFVASYLLSRDTDSGAITSLAVWSEGADTLLPEADVVQLVAAGPDGVPAKRVGLVPFERVRAVAGALLEPADETAVPGGGLPLPHLPRYRVRTFPDRSLLEKLNA